MIFFWEKKKKTQSEILELYLKISFCWRQFFPKTIKNLKNFSGAMIVFVWV